jgi:hypothetical protein
MTVARQVVAVGGGGFLMDDGSGRQERFILSVGASATLQPWPARALTDAIEPHEP